MSKLSSVIPLLGCAASCALAGCCSTTKQACTACAPQSAAFQALPAYENYTPPPAMMRPIPAPSAESFDAPPPPPQTRSIPNSKVDFFESANSRSSR